MGNLNFHDQHKSNIIVSEQIDIIICGSHSKQFLKLMLECQTQVFKQGVNKNNSFYREILNKIFQKTLIHNRIHQQQQQYKRINNINKFTRILLTSSFWLHFNFFIHELQIYDPILSDITKNNISICILASNSQSTQTKNYLQNNNNIDQNNNNQFFKEFIKNNKNQTIIETYIFQKIHQLKIKGFNAVLGVKINQDGRIVQESSNLKLTIYQIYRWITDRHFEIYHKIKLLQDLGDQIQYYQEKNQKKYCQII